MKTKIMFIIMIVITTLGLIVGNAQTGKAPEAKQDKAKVENTSQKPMKVTAGDGHSKLPIECRNCHSCDFPTKRNPCLNDCPRNEIITIDHKPEEGPEYVVLNQKGKDYGDVVFSHYIHAQMSDISMKCDGCHHYNTAGPIEKCSACHEENRKRTDISRPDLKGALHRQCFTCHRQWSHSNDCNYCHLPKAKDNISITNNKIKKLVGKSHPEYAAQPKIVYETNYKEGKLVTFYHDEHVNLFNLSCQSCHKSDKCTKCHDVDKTYDKPRKHDLKGKSFEVVHQNCISCHKDNSCNKCHQDGIKERFDHKSTGFDLGKYHSKLACSKCHSKTNPMDKPSKNCLSCHKNFTSGKYNHDRTGFRLDDLHKDLDCDNCHKNNNFATSPGCSDCHDGFTYPKQKPGKAVAR